MYILTKFILLLTCFIEDPLEAVLLSPEFVKLSLDLGLVDGVAGRLQLLQLGLEVLVQGLQPGELHRLDAQIILKEGKIIV